MTIKKRKKAATRGAKAKASRGGGSKTRRAGKRKAARKRQIPAASGYQTSWRAARDPEQSEGARIEAIAKLTNAICDDQQVFKGMLEVLRDTAESLAVRLAALAAIQAASFSAVKFSACRPAYMAALRAVATDPESEMRNRALGLLSREGDGRAQELLLEGLKNPTKALVPPEKALQLLSYDVKAEAYPVARKIVEQPPNTEAKREALRLLAADAKSAKVFEKILRDKKESPEARQISAAALQALDPDTLQTYAREIVLDPAESPELQAASLTALAQFGKVEELAQDEALSKRVKAMQTSGAPESVKESAKQFTDKYGS